MEQAKNYDAPFSILREHFNQLDPAEKMRAIKAGCTIVNLADETTRRPPEGYDAGDFNRLSQWQQAQLIRQGVVIRE
jgi:hypothetical protein